jgi:hypothetical protein
MAVFVSRGVFDEVHAGEIDPGILYLIDENNRHVGYAWRNRKPISPFGSDPLAKWVLLFDTYQTIPGDPNYPYPRVPKSALRFEWKNLPMKHQDAVNEYLKAHPNAEWILVRQEGTIEAHSANAQVP